MLIAAQARVELLVARLSLDPGIYGVKEAGMAGHGPDDMGDDEQETEIAEYELYIEDPPDNLVIAEDDDDDAEAVMDWAALHPREAQAEEEAAERDLKEQREEVEDVAAEDAAVHETRKP